jgi:hypothetical protein
METFGNIFGEKSCDKNLQIFLLLFIITQIINCQIYLRPLSKMETFGNTF